MYNFAELEARRKRLGIAQRDLCEAADVNASTYSRCKDLSYEPTQRTLRKLAKALGKLTEAKRAELQALTRELDERTEAAE